MPRVQSKITDEQMSALRRESASSGHAVSALVRLAISEYVARRERQAAWDRALKAVGTGHSGLGDLAERHDDYLAEDFDS